MISGRAYISSTAPIMVVKYVSSDGGVTHSQPAMAIVQPVRQFHNDYDFAVSFYSFRYRLLNSEYMHYPLLLCLGYAFLHALLEIYYFSKDKACFFVRCYYKNYKIY